MLGQELPALIRDGYTSFKVYMTYDLLQLDDGQMLDILAVARREGALVMVHAENHDMIKWLTARLLERGLGAPRYHAVSHARLAEGEATNRAVALSQLLDVPILHRPRLGRRGDRGDPQRADQGAQDLRRDLPAISVPDRRRHRQARTSRAPNSAAARRRATTRRRRRCGAGLRNGTFQVFSSDHAPYRFDASGKLPKGDKTTFKDIANGVPGHRVARCRCCFPKGVGQGRLDLNAFVALTATNHAKLYGLYPKKGTIAVGSDADIAIWDPERETTVTAGMLHDNVGYTPYEGRRLRGWPVTVIEPRPRRRRGRQARTPSAAAAPSCPAPCPTRRSPWAPRFRNSPLSPKPASRSCEAEAGETPHPYRHLRAGGVTIAAGCGH